MPEYYIAVFKEMLEALNNGAIDNTFSAQEILFLKTVDLDEA
jgi:hypothetical protein